MTGFAMTETAPISVVLDDDETSAAHAAGQQAWWLYSTEVLDHARLPYRVVAPGELPLADTRVLVFAQPPRLSADQSTVVADWVRGGGVLILSSGPGSLASTLGVSTAGDVADGHVVAEDGTGWLDAPDVALHALGGGRLVAGDDVTVLTRWRDDDAAALVAKAIGDGQVVVSGVDVWQTIVRIQQGDRVERDGVPAADGSAPVDDDILKCDDGIVLSYEDDRALPPGETGMVPYNYSFPPPAAAPMFHRPQADMWRRVFLTSLFTAAEKADVVLPWLFYWPAGVPAIAHMSHDSDGNNSEHAATALDVFDEAGVKVTWCNVYPGGYTPEIVAEIEARGHEHALHYNAMADADIATWGWPQMRAQYAWAQALTGREDIVSNKNHYTRWEGWHEFFGWCERLGIQIDQTRGPSKLGNVGFPFGSCHLWFPIADASEQNRRIDVLELPLHTQDLAWAGHESIRDVILDQSLAEHGVAHFLFHSPHLHLRPPTRAACVRVANEARDRGMPWWTSEQINAWERARRDVDLRVEYTSDGEMRVSVTAATPVAGAAVLLAVPGLGDDEKVPVVAGDAAASVVTRHHRRFVELAADLPAGTTTFVVRRNAV